MCGWRDTDGRKGLEGTRWNTNTVGHVGQLDNGPQSSILVSLDLNLPPAMPVHASGLSR